MKQYTDPPGFDEWYARVPESLKRDPIWRTPAYRYAMWLSDLAVSDTDPLFETTKTRRLADQLLRAVQGISANLSEGYGCVTGPERARYYDYALTSAREAHDWYFKARHYLDEKTVAERLDLLGRIIRILTAVIPRERTRTLRRTATGTPRPGASMAPRREPDGQ